MWTHLLCVILVVICSKSESIDNEFDYDVTTPVIYDESDYVDFNLDKSPPSLPDPGNPEEKFRMIKSMRNTTRDAGGSLKLRCEAAGNPRATSWQWFKNDAPVIVEKGRVRIKSSLEDSPQWSMLKINVLETLGKSYFSSKSPLITLNTVPTIVSLTKIKNYEHIMKKLKGSEREHAKLTRANAFMNLLFKILKMRFGL